jgi:ABC-type glycerol-3-phosphate transport system substrate-binding protein
MKTGRIFRRVAAVCAITVATLALSGCGFKTTPTKYAVKLEVWGVFDDSEFYQSVFDAYRKINPYVTVEYRKMNVETYKQDLIEAMASGNGPDIFMLRNSWVAPFQDKIVPAPATFADPRAFREAFVDVVSNDFMDDGRTIYGSPLSVDSLALYYNKDIFTAAGILYPPKTWEEFVSDTVLLTKVDQFGTIVSSGAALGTVYNINRSTDVLAAMMLQAGVPTRPDKDSREGIDLKLGLQAFDFYTSFSNTQSPAYSWNARQHYSLDAFAEGQTAMMINYSWQYETLKRKNAKLNIGIAPLPQFEQNGVRANYANYWGYAVAKNKDFGSDAKDPNAQNKMRIHEAWQLLEYLTMPHPNKTVTLRNAVTGTAKEFPLSADPAEMYLDRTRKPAARRDLVNATRRDLILGPFVEGLLSPRIGVNPTPKRSNRYWAR